MAANSKIEWTDATWSPLRVWVRLDAAEIARAKGYSSLIHIAEKTAGQPGQHCEHVSEGCKRCYSETWQARCLQVNGTGLPFDRRSRDLVEPFVDEAILRQPLKWKVPKLIFVENQSDLFGEWNEDYQIAQVFAVMGLCHWHTFQVLTKREQRMRELLASGDFRTEVATFISDLAMEMTDCFERRSGDLRATAPSVEENEDWPLPNVWLGISVENQATADARIPRLLQTPANVRFVSYEPALGPVRLTRIEHTPEGSGGTCYIDALAGRGCSVGGSWNFPKLDWVIAGGESGPGARPAHPDWFRSIRDQCVAAGVPFFFKQWGEWIPRSVLTVEEDWPVNEATVDHPNGRAVMSRIGKKKAGALLDGCEWKQFPEARQVAVR